VLGKSVKCGIIQDPTKQLAQCPMTNTERLLGLAESSTGGDGLSRGESSEFPVIGVDAATENRVAVGPLNEAGTVRVERLVNGGSSGGCALELVGRDGLVERYWWLEHADNGTHSKLDEVKRQEPDDVPDPDNSNPGARDTFNIGEAPVTESSNQRRDELGDNEGTKQSCRGALHEEPSVGSGDKDQGLGNDGNLKVDDHVQTGVILVL